MAYNEVLIPLVVALSGTDDWSLGEIAITWAAIDTCRASSKLWPLRSHKKTQTFLFFHKVSIRVLIGVITGHYQMELFV